MVIHIFGDSITQGFWSEHGGWADQIKRYVMAEDIKRGYKGYHGIFNLGIDSNFTADVIGRFDNEIGARRFPGADVRSDYGIIFAIGINDTLHINNDFQSSPEQYGKDLYTLLQKAKKLTSRIAFVNLLPIDEDSKVQATASKTLYYTNDRIELFNNELELFCTENSLTLIDVRSLFASDYSLFSPDGTHPNTLGHKAIYSAVLPTINSWLYDK